MSRELQRIDVEPAHANVPMQVRAGRQPCIARHSHEIALFDLLAGRHLEFREMIQARVYTPTMIDHDRVAAHGQRLGNHHDTIGRSIDRRAGRDSEVGAFVITGHGTTHIRAARAEWRADLDELIDRHAEEAVPVTLRIEHSPRVIEFLELGGHQRRIEELLRGLVDDHGPAGLTLVIVREDLLGHALPVCPSAFDYKTVADNQSMFNTPPTYGIYMAGLIFQWLKKLGGGAESDQHERFATRTTDFGRLLACRWQAYNHKGGRVERLYRSNLEAR